MRPSAQLDLGRYDMVVVGASGAGLSAALVLGRARRRVLVLDDGQAAPLLGSSATAGNVPLEGLRIGREQLRYYRVKLQAGEVRVARRDGDGFLLTLASGATVRAGALVLATGLTNELPPVPGIAKQWGQRVYDCPYCHGWESRHSRVVVYGRGEAGYQQAVQLHQWCASLWLCTDGPANLTPAQGAHLAALGVPVVETPVAALNATARTLIALDFVDGTRQPLDALFVRPVQRQRSALAAHLGCAFAPDEVYVQVNEAGRTTVPNVYAVGEMTGPFQQAILAVASGTRAAAALNNELIFRSSVTA